MISTHILDTSLGHPAAGVEVELAIQAGASTAPTWTRLALERTNSDGRIVFATPVQSGIYRLQFKVAEYFQKSGLTPFFVEAPVIFEVKDTTRKYHVPLLLNPYGYSTYRGS